MKTMKIDGLKLDECDVRGFLDSFFSVNKLDVVTNVQAKLVTPGTFDIKVHYVGKLVLPFGNS